MIELSRGARVGESQRDRSIRFDREFVPIPRDRLHDRPVAEDCRDSVDLDQQSKEKLAELRKSGIAQRFWEALEAQETLYYRSFPELAWTGTNIVMWHALQDLCESPPALPNPGSPGAIGDSTSKSEVPEDVRVYARHYRWLRVRDVIRAEREA